MRQRKNKFGRKLLAQLLAICMVFTMLPTAAFAEETTPEQQPVDSGIMEVEDETTSADVPAVYTTASGAALQMGAGGIGDGNTIYFGKYTENGTTYDVPWTVLPSTTLSETSVAEGTPVLPLLSTYTLGATQFQSSGSGYYPSSTLQAAMTAIYNGFDSNEQDATDETTLTESSMYSGEGDLAAQRLFPLSYEEASSLIGNSAIMQPKPIVDPTGSASGWWLRTSMMDDEVYSGGSRFPFDTDRARNTEGVRPAFHLDKSVVILASAADGKDSGTLGATALTAVPETTPSVWKLTLPDSAYNSFSAETTAVNGKVLTVTYSGARTGTNEYISAVIWNARTNAFTYYGRLAQPSAAAGTVDIDLSSVSLEISDFLYILNEQYNGDNKTDYASELKMVSLTPDLTVTGGAKGEDYTYASGVLTIKSGTAMTVAMAEGKTTTTDRIVIGDGVTANLTFDGISIDCSTAGGAAAELTGNAKLNLTLAEGSINTLKSGTKCAGISAPEGTTLSIGGSGTLNVFGGMYGAGIGGGTVAIANDPYPEYEFYGADAGTINISGGTVNATGGNWAAGIGGGAGFERESGDIVGGSGGTVTITGGTVNASAGVGGVHPVTGEFGGGAGIGGGGALATKSGGAGGNITISGGTVNADSVDSDNLSVGGGAAIGGGYRGEAGNITISAGMVVAEAGLGGAGIGSGSFCEGGGVIKISAGSVTATGGKSAAGIGTGWTDGMGRTPPTEIVISGGRVTATGGNGLVHPTRGTMGAGAGIGGGYWNVGSNVTISGGIVSATGGSLSGAYDDTSTVPSAIGAGSNNSGTHRFTTGQSGSAVINAKTPAMPSSGYITGQSNKAIWLGTIFEGIDGTVYGSQTINDDFTIDAGQTLTIPAAASFTIAAGVTITNNGSIVNNGLSRNNGTIAGSGTVTCNNHNWDKATYTAPKTCAFCKITEGEHLPRVRYGIMEGAGELYQDDKICFGNYSSTPVLWRVLDTKTNTGADGLFLLSEYLLEQKNKPFDANGGANEGQTNPNEWQQSDAQAWCTTFAGSDAFTVAEKAAFKSVSKTDAETNQYSISWGTSSLVDEKVFYLSAEEAANYIGPNNGDEGLATTTSDGAAGGWWLRSPLYADTGAAGSVNKDGGVEDVGVKYAGIGVRPAFNLDSGVILFSSAANGGKTANGMDTALTAISTTTSTAWKLTLSDSGRSDFTAETTGKSGDVLTVSYTGATTGDNEYISAVVKNENGEITYYGRVAAANAATGTATIDLSGVTMDAADTLYVFNEQYNGDNKTDYASELKEVALTVTPPPATQYTISVSASPAAGGSVTGEGKFDENASRTVTAKANTNYHFVKWTESGTQVSTNASYTFNLTADRTLVAVFEVDTPTPATQYQVTKGKNGIWTKGNIGGLEFTVNANYSKFTTGGSVLVDGTEIASDKYTSQSGSTIITLKAEYLETLSAGQHSLRVNFADGYAETHFTIKAATAETGGNGDDDQNPNTGVPQTGDNSYMPLWILLILISAGGIISVGIKQKKRKS